MPRYPGTRRRQSLRLAAVRLALILWFPTAPALLRSFGRQVINFIGVHVEHDLPPARVRVADRHCRGVLLVDLVAAEVANKDCLACQLNLQSIRER